MSTFIFPPKFKTHKLSDDYPNDELFQVFRGKNAIVSCISPWAWDIQQRIIDVAVKAGDQRFKPAVFTYDTANAKAIAILPPLQIRADEVNHLKAQESAGLTWTAIVTGSFFDWGLVNGFAGFDLATHEAMIYDDGDQRFSTSTFHLVGSAVAKVLLQPDVTANRYVYVSSFTTTQNEILSELEDISGVEWKVTRVDSKTKIREGQGGLKTDVNVVDAARLLILALSYTPGNGMEFSG